MAKKSVGQSANVLSPRRQKGAGIDRSSRHRTQVRAWPSGGEGTGGPDPRHAEEHHAGRAGDAA